MERDQFHAETATIEETATDASREQPVLRIHFDGPRDHLRQKLSERLREDLAAGRTPPSRSESRVRADSRQVP
ncbi:hypothetical protein JCM31271_30660 [Halorubrum trueperi]